MVLSHGGLHRAYRRLVRRANAPAFIAPGRTRAGTGSDALLGAHRCQIEIYPGGEAGADGGTGGEAGAGGGTGDREAGSSLPRWTASGASA
jgi:hypothetical protein